MAAESTRGVKSVLCAERHCGLLWRWVFKCERFSVDCVDRKLAVGAFLHSQIAGDRAPADTVPLPVTEHLDRFSRFPVQPGSVTRDFNEKPLSRLRKANDHLLFSFRPNMKPFLS